MVVSPFLRRSATDSWQHVDEQPLGRGVGFGQLGGLPFDESTLGEDVASAALEQIGRREAGQDRRPPTRKMSSAVPRVGPVARTKT